MSMVTRYWRTTVAGLGLGFLLGLCLFGVFVVAGNPDWRGYLTLQTVLEQSALFGVIGLIVASASSVGGWVFVLLYDRRLEKSPRIRVALAAAGAATGVGLLGIAVAVGDALNGFSLSIFPVAIGLILAVGAAVAAALLVARAEKRPPESRAEAPQLSNDGRWVDF
jgi:hypothetical protein